MANANIKRVFDTVRPYQGAPIYAVRGDYEARYIQAVIAADGKPIQVSAIESVAINAKRPDGESKAFYGSVNNDGTVTVPIPQFILDVEGDVECTISVISTNTKLSTTQFIVVSQPAPYNGQEVSPDDPEYDVIVAALAAENERRENERQRVAAEELRVEAEEKRAEEFDGWKIGVFTESDPTVPAWAKKPNPPTAAEIGAAPAGFGLGALGVMVSDPDSVTKSGFYQFVSDQLTGSALNWYLISQHHTEAYAYQIASSVVGGNVVQRIKNNREWNPWEWVNPPMQLGVEYRTTERWKGQPVYVKMVDCGEMPSAGTHKNITVSTGVSYTHKIVGMECVFESEPYGEYGIKRCCVNYCTETNNTGEIKGIAWAYSIDTTINVTIKALGDITSYTAVATVKYVK